MSVDDDLPWDEDAESPSWYDVPDDSRWDPDDDGLPQATEDPNRDDGAEVVLYRFRAPGGVVAPGSGPTEDAGRDISDPADVAEPTDGDESAGGADPVDPAAGREMPRRPSGVFGLAAGALSDATRFIEAVVGPTGAIDDPAVGRVIDTAVGIGTGALALTETVVGTAARLTRPLVDIALHPPLVPRRWQPAGVLEQFEGVGRRSRRLGERDVQSLIDLLLPAIVDAVLDRLDLTDIVLDRVDLGRVIAAVDLNAVVDRIDIASIVDRVDIDAVLGRVDLDAVIATVDLDKIIERVDIDAVIDRLDLDALVAGVDLNKVISTVDVNAVVGTVDIDAIIDRVDVAGIAEDVIVEVNLPRIIRESSSSIATETMIGVRMGSASADQGLSRLLEKLRLRRRADPEEPDPTILELPVLDEPPSHRERRGAPAPSSLAERSDPPPTPPDEQRESPS